MHNAVAHEWDSHIIKSVLNPMPAAFHHYYKMYIYLYKVKDFNKLYFLHMFPWRKYNLLKSFSIYMEFVWFALIFLVLL